MISRCIFFMLQPLATNSSASQSSSSGWSGRIAHHTEIAGSADDTAAEVVMPEPVDHDARRQRVVRLASQFASAVRRPVDSTPCRRHNLRRGRVEDGKEPGLDLFRGASYAPAASTCVAAPDGRHPVYPRPSGASPG